MTVGIWIYQRGKDEGAARQTDGGGSWVVILKRTLTGHGWRTDDAAQAPGWPMLALEFPRTVADFPEKRGSDGRP